MPRRLLELLIATFLVCSLAAPGFAQDDDKDKKDDEQAATEDGDKADAESNESAPAAQAEAGSSASSLQRGRRMEFDARLIRGERASGAVFLFQRAQRPLPSMVKRRTSYLDDTVLSTLGDETADTFRTNQSDAIKKRIRQEEEERRKAREASQSGAAASKKKEAAAERNNAPKADVSNNEKSDKDDKDEDKPAKKAKRRKRGKKKKK